MDATIQARRRHARLARIAEKVRDVLPECESCGAPIYRPGLCGTCAEVYEYSREIPVSGTVDSTFTPRINHVS